MKPGIHRIPEDVYHADPAPEPSLSSTLAREIIRHSPLHAWVKHPRLNPAWEPEVKATFDIGRAAHRAVLGVGADYEAYPEELLAVNGAASTKAAKAWAEEARARGITPLKADDVEKIERMAAKLRWDLKDFGIEIDPEHSEVAALAEIDGIWARAMVDNAPPGRVLYDFKTTTDASPAACERAVMTYGYDEQAAHYLDCWKAATGEERRFRFIFQEKEPPYEISVIELGGDDIEMARRKMRRAREVWRECLRSGHWPGYPRGVIQIDLPDFYHARWLERESVEEEHKRRTGADILDFARRWQSPEGVAS
ncbi:MAG: hypothetical protein D6811_06670 [Alphaproteobacteria bacterium]|nr:MAG: hypothetical protein D6811_06670 [Alphaproteobacteria bacterium]